MDYVVLVTFPTSERDRAYKAYTNINATKGDAGYNIRDIAVIAKRDGVIYIPDEYNTGSDFGEDTVYGGLIGALIGIIGGPIGVLLGASVGLASGAVVDSMDVDDDDALLLKVATSLEDGQTALAVLVSEEDPDEFDSNFTSENVRIQRWDAAEIQAELEQAKIMQKELAKEARKKMRHHS